MMPTPRRLAPLCAAVLFAAACDNAEPNAPAELEPASVAIALQFPSSLASVSGLEEAYLKTNRLWLQFRDGASTRDERQIEFQPTRQESQVPLLIRLRSPREAMQFNIEVRLGSAGVFRGTAPVTLRAGRLTTVTTTLLPVLAGVRAQDSVPVITAWGDTIRVAAAGVLATGDTIEGVPVSWKSLDPGVASIATDGTVVGINDGVARAVATADAFSDTTLVRVQAGIARIVVSPGGTSTIPLKGKLQLTATLYDSRGNVLPSRPVTWTSTGPATITVSPTGLATAVGIGTTQVRATVGTVSATVDVTGIPIAPQTDSLKATVTGFTSATLRALVLPNGAATQSSFEWGAPQITIPPSVLLPQAVGSGLLAVPVTTTLTGLRPNTLYYALVRASNSAGSAVSDTIWFNTGNPGGSGSGAPSAITEGWTSIQPGWVALIGSVDADGQPAEAWFEWGTDPTLAVAQKTPLRNVSGNGRITVTEPVQVTVGTTYFFRFVARTSGGTSNGAILSMTPGTPKEPTIITTGPVTNLTYDGATLNGNVVPNGLTTMAWFDWGTSPTLGTYASSPKTGIGGGYSAVGVSFDLSALLPETTYYFRLNASNNAGTTSSVIFSFTTPANPNALPPGIGAVQATNITQSGATLNGSVTPNSAPTSASFDWGTSPTLATFSSSPAQALGSGTTAVGLSFDLVALAPNTTYYFRLTASNSAGANSSPIVSFTTLPDPNVVPPAVSTNPPTGGDLPQLRGIANPNGAATTVWFEWGPDASLSSFTSTPQQAIGSGTTPVSFSAPRPAGTGYYRAVARNDGGTVYGAIIPF